MEILKQKVNICRMKFNFLSTQSEDIREIEVKIIIIISMVCMIIGELQLAKQWRVFQAEYPKVEFSIESEGDYMKWNIVHECDDDNGEPTQWACKLEDGQFVWTDKIGERAYGITNKASGDNYLYVAGSLQGAKRWVNKNLIKVL